MQAWRDYDPVGDRPELDADATRALWLIVSVAGSIMITVGAFLLGHGLPV